MNPQESRISHEQIVYARWLDWGTRIGLMLLIGTFALVWSMNRHLKRLPKTFDGDGPDQPDQAGETGAEPSGGSDGTEKSAHEPGG